MSLKKLQHHKISLLAEILLTFNDPSMRGHWSIIPGRSLSYQKGMILLDVFQVSLRIFSSKQILLIPFGVGLFA